MRKEASDSAESYGVLPVGTVLTLKGQRQGEFLAVKVELEDGVLEGWIPRDAISRDAFDGEEVRPKKKRLSRDDDEDRPTLRPRSKLRIPRDEGLLLRRESSFFYGLQLSPMFVILTDSAGIQYLGPGGEVGGHIGLFIAQNFKIHVEAGYFIVNGASQNPSGSGSGTATPSGTTASSVTFGYLDVGTMIAYEINPVEIFAKVKYAFGLSLSDLPSTISVGNAADLSSLWVQGGVGYRIPINEMLDLSLRAHWGLSLLKSPVSITGGGLGAYLSFKG